MNSAFSAFHFSVDPIFGSPQYQDGRRTRPFSYHAFPQTANRTFASVVKSLIPQMRTEKLVRQKNFKKRDAGQLISQSHRTRVAMTGSLPATRGWAGRWKGAGKLETGKHGGLARSNLGKPHQPDLQVATPRQLLLSATRCHAAGIKRMVRKWEVRKWGSIGHSNPNANHHCSLIFLSHQSFCRPNTTMVAERDHCRVPSYRAFPQTSRRACAPVAKIAHTASEDRKMGAS